MIYTKLDNPHAHFTRPECIDDLANLGNNFLGGIDLCSVTHWGDRVKKCLNSEDLERISKRYSIFKNIGNQTHEMEFYGRKVTLYCSQEIRTKQGLHITSECCDQIEEGLDARETVDRIHENGGRAILEHPFTIDTPFMQYRYVLRDFDKEKISVMHDLLEIVDGVEVFNSMCTLWQFYSNYLSKDLVDSFIARTGKYVPGLVGGDEHYNLVGDVGNLLPMDDLRGFSGQEIQDWRWDQYSNGNFKRKERLTDLSVFSKHMILPFFKRLFGFERRDFKDKDNFKVI